MKKICYTLVLVLVVISAPVAAMEKPNPPGSVKLPRSVVRNGLKKGLQESEAARKRLEDQNADLIDQVAALTAQNADLTRKVKTLEAVQNASLQKAFDAAREEWAAVEKE